jgi:hypothetical protein
MTRSLPMGENCMATEKLRDMMYHMTRAYGNAALAIPKISKFPAL